MSGRIKENGCRRLYIRQVAEMLLNAAASGLDHV